MKDPRKDGIAQNEHRRSQPDAIFNGATGSLLRRLRTTRWPWPSEPTASEIGAGFVAWRSLGASGRSDRRSFGLCASIEPPAIMVWRRCEISS